MFGGIPFEHFAGGGGMPGGGMPGRGRSSEPVDTTKLYETLEVEKDATPKEIKKSYFKLSRVCHCGYIVGIRSFVHSLIQYAVGAACVGDSAMTDCLANGRSSWTHQA